MNDFQQEIYKTIDILTEEKLKQLGYDKTKRGRIISINSDNCIVEIDGDNYTCKIRKGVYLQPNDIVFVKFPQNNNIDKYIDATLGNNEIPEHLVISAEEILTKLKTVDGHNSGLDADMLDGKHGGEYATTNSLEEHMVYSAPLLENTKGTISAKEDTGEVTNEYVRQVNASDSSTASGTYSQVNASDSSTASGNRSQVNSSYDSIANEVYSQVNASDSCQASGNRSQVNASQQSIANKSKSQVNASINSTASGECSQVNASSNSTASEIKSQVNVAYDSFASGKYSQVNVAYKSSLSGKYNQVNVGYNVINDVDFSSAWGYSTSGEPSTQNKKVEISSENGTIKASGAITGNSSFADFAEYFESENGESIPLGTIVSLAQNGKIKVASRGEHMVGVISQTAGVILNAQGFEWKDRYLYDRYGQPLLVDKEVINDETEEVEIIKAPMLNINWDENEEYVAREDRPEWNVVGLTGQIFANVDETVQEGDFIKVGENGIGTKGRNGYGQNWQVMKITTKYEAEIRFGIALVFVR